MKTKNDPILAVDLLKSSNQKPGSGTLDYKEKEYHHHEQESKRDINVIILKEI